MEVFTNQVEWSAAPVACRQPKTDMVSGLGHVRTQEWPKEMKADLAWVPSAFSSEKDYTHTMSADEVTEVRAALDDFKNLGLYGSDVTAANFPLPTLGPKLQSIAKEIHLGKGFAVIRGPNPADFSPEDNVLIFLGISSYIGSKRGRQDEHGNMLMHIQNAKQSSIAQNDRPARYSSRASEFHTDSFCDILAMQTRNNAAVGGRSVLASSWTVYNKIAAMRPDLIELMAQPIWPFDIRGNLFWRDTRPLLFYHGGRILLNYAREPLLGLAGVRRPAGLATLTPLQREALDLLEEVARESQVMLDVRPGDMVFLNNHAVLHSREAFEDVPELPQRYLVRMWLKHPVLAWKLPRPLQDGNQRIYGDIGVPERWNVVDVPRLQFRLAERFTP